jgi:hypothetical protein
LRLDEAPRAITERDCGKGYYSEYRDMLVANATCPSCEAEYLAWITAPSHWGSSYGKDGDGKTPFDTSYRSSFDDEPGGRSDLPKYVVEMRRHRIRAFDPHAEGYGGYCRDEKPPEPYWSAEYPRKGMVEK